MLTIFSSLKEMLCITIAGFIIIFSENTFAQTTSLNFTHHGKSRNCLIHLPPSYNTSTIYPLVLNLHGYNMTNILEEIYTGMDGVADTAGFIVAYPNGIGMAWDTIFVNSPVDDVGFLNRLIDTLLARYAIDTTRIYATGMSMGGFMAYRLACESGERLAAIASVAGPSVDAVLSMCDSAPRLPVMHIHGTADSTIPYSGTILFNNIDSTIQYFLDKNGCSSSPVVYNFPDIVSSDRCTVASYDYSCEGSSEVLFYKVTGGGHTWPGGIPIPNLGNTNADINASVEIWKFFKRHERKSAATGILISSQNNLMQVFPNPADNHLQIVLPQNAVRGGMHVQLFDAMGKIHKAYFLTDSQNRVVSVADYANGIYVVRVVTTNYSYQSRVEIRR